MLKNNRWIAFAFGIGALTIAAPASASPITVTNVQVPYYESVTLHDGVLGAGNSMSIGIAGQIDLTTNIGLLGTWCVDLLHHISLGGHYTYLPGPLVTDNFGSSPATSNPLTALQLQTIEKLAAYGNGTMATTPSNAFSAALQAAIWDTEYHTTATGSAQFTTALANIMTILPTLPVFAGYQLYNTDAQNLYQSQGLFVSQVPEPATIGLFCSGLAAAGLLRRRRKTKAQTASL